MKENISILILAFLFFISTTGLPVFSHFCKAAGASVTDECNDCLVVEDISASCCFDEIVKPDEKFAAGLADCCVDELDYKKIEDRYSNSLKNNLNSGPINFDSFDGFVPDLNETKKSEKDSFNNPPHKYGRELLQAIHQLKLDTPIS